MYQGRLVSFSTVFFGKPPIFKENLGYLPQVFDNNWGIDFDIWGKGEVLLRWRKQTLCYIWHKELNSQIWTNKKIIYLWTEEEEAKEDLITVRLRPVLFLSLLLLQLSPKTPSGLSLLFLFTLFLFRSLLLSLNHALSTVRKGRHTCVIRMKRFDCSCRSWS